MELIIAWLLTHRLTTLGGLGEGCDIQVAHSWWHIVLHPIQAFSMGEKEGGAQ